MKTSSTAASAAILASLFGSISAAPFRPLARDVDSAIQVTFNGARNDGDTIQAIGMLWPVDGKTYSPQQVATDYPAANYVDIAMDKRVQNAGQSISTGDIVNDGDQITCTFTGVDGTTHTINNFPTDDEVVTFTIGPPTAFSCGTCHYVS